MTGQEIKRTQCSAHAPRNIVFLIYQNRTGSTFLANELSAHPLVAVPPEGHTALEPLLGCASPDRSLEERKATLLASLTTDRKLSAWQIDPVAARDPLLSADSELEALFRLCDCFADAHKPDATTVVVKGYFLQKLIERHGFAKLQAGRTVRALFLLRDPRAMFASQRRSISTNNGRPMQDNPLVAAIRWRQAARSARYFSASPWGMTVRYEDLVAKNEETLAAIGEFLEIDFGARQLGAASNSQLHAMIPPAQQHLHRNISKGPLVERINSWRGVLSRTESSVISFITGSALASGGYERRAEDRMAPADIAALGQMTAAAGLRRARKALFASRAKDVATPEG